MHRAALAMLESMAEEHYALLLTTYRLLLTAQEVQPYATYYLMLTT